MTTDKHWTLGVLKGKKHKSLVTLLAGDSFTLSLAGHSVLLIDVLSFEEKSLTLDQAELFRRVDKPAGHNEPAIPEARRTRLKARIHAERAKGTRAFLRVVAKEGGHRGIPVKADHFKQAGRSHRLTQPYRASTTRRLNKNRIRVGSHSSFLENEPGYELAPSR